MDVTAEDVLRLIQQEGIELIDLKFSDLRGQWQHLTIAPSLLVEGVFDEGISFDGSAIRDWKSIHESELMLLPDPATTWLDPFHSIKTMSMVGSILKPLSGEPFQRCPRALAERAVRHLGASGVADQALFSPEPEFFLFDDVRYESGIGGSFYQVDSIEAPWNTGRLEEGGNLAHKLQLNQGYLPTSPCDSLQELRSEMLLTLASLGISIEKHHHEVGIAQHKLGIKANELLTAADYVMTYKYVVKNVAKKYGKTATFMPNPVFMNSGSRMHVHQSLWKEKQPLFFGEGTYADLSQTARWYVGGLLRHGPSLMAFTNPSTNSYKRLLPGFEVPLKLIYSQGNRSAAIRIPLSGSHPSTKRIEFRIGDPLANPYLSFSAMLMAGLDGVHQQIDPGKGMDLNLVDLSSSEVQEIPNVPDRLEAALQALDNDRAYLLKGNVFSDDLIDGWIAIKSQEIVEINQRPHPHEFSLYYNS